MQVPVERQPGRAVLQLSPISCDLRLRDLASFIRSALQRHGVRERDLRPRPFILRIGLGIRIGWQGAALTR